MKQSIKQQEWKKKHYIENKDFYMSKQSERRAFIKDYLNKIKKESGCIKCKYNNHPEVLEFHHRNGTEKDDNVSSAIKNKWGQKRINEEIDKCDVLCANCHREYHIEND